MELNSTPVVSYQYDSTSRLVQRVEGGTITNYTWDGWDLIKEVKSGTVNETTNYLVPNAEILAFERGGDWFYLHGDGLSSTQLVTDENGDQVGRFIYGAWGEELYANESVPGILETRFVGGLGCRKDAATGLIYMRNRWYSCELQRFISRDPVGLKGGFNLYEYADSIPNSLIDEDGLEPGRDPFQKPNLNGGGGAKGTKPPGPRAPKTSKGSKKSSGKKGGGGGNMASSSSSGGDWDETPPLGGVRIDGMPFYPPFLVPGWPFVPIDLCDKPPTYCEHLKEACDKYCYTWFAGPAAHPKALGRCLYRFCVVKIYKSCKKGWLRGGPHWPDYEDWLRSTSMSGN